VIRMIRSRAWLIGRAVFWPQPTPFFRRLVGPRGTPSFPGGSSRHVVVRPEPEGFSSLFKVGGWGRLRIIAGMEGAPLEA
jgi:hypothetical protein